MDFKINEQVYSEAPSSEFVRTWNFHGLLPSNSLGTARTRHFDAYEARQRRLHKNKIRILRVNLRDGTGEVPPARAEFESLEVERRSLTLVHD